MNLILTIATSLSLIAVAVAAGHHETAPSGWYEYSWDDHDERVLHCNALWAMNLGSGLFYHPRPAPTADWYSSSTQSPSYWLHAVGERVDSDSFDSTPHRSAGTWIYQESNGVLGIQIGGVTPAGQVDNVDSRCLGTGSDLAVAFLAPLSGELNAVEISG